MLFRNTLTQHTSGQGGPVTLELYRTLPQPVPPQNSFSLDIQQRITGLLDASVVTADHESWPLHSSCASQSLPSGPWDPFPLPPRARPRESRPTSAARGLQRQETETSTGRHRPGLLGRPSSSISTLARLASHREARHLCRLVLQYAAYYHDDRSHLGLEKDTPHGRPIQQPGDSRSKVVALPRLGGLHHRYVWRSAA